MNLKIKLLILMIYALVSSLALVSTSFAGAKSDGEAFLEKNKKVDGVIVLDSGMQYKILTQGSGKKPKKTDTVVAHYKGTLLNGTVFDSSYARNQPLTFGLNRVIRGWQEIIPMMPIGSKWQVFIPYDLAYGSQGAGRMIKPYETLIFDIELVGVK